MGIFHRGGRLALVAGLTAVLTLTATPGWADKEVVKDARRDVASITFESLLFGDYVINAAPDETPTSRPSSRAARRAVPMASSAVTRMTSS